MTYLAVNKDGTEIISDNFEFDADCNRLDYKVILPKCSIQKLIGHELTWND